MKKSLLKKYARLIIRVGANVQKGQSVVINCSADQHDFCTLVVEECYRAGARYVNAVFSDDRIMRLKYRKETLKTLSQVLPFEEAKMKWMSEELPVRIRLVSEDPDGMKGVNPAKVQKMGFNRFKVLKQYSDAMESKHQWTIAAVPSGAWAKKVFPGMRTSMAVERLWQAILETVYITDKSDPVEVWAKVNADFKHRCDELNKNKFEYLTYKSSNGTDFRVWLTPRSKWCGGGETDLKGHFFNPNLPTVEVFTTPLKGKAEGKLVSTKPLSYGGQLIENFSFVFKDGKVVSCEAEKGQNVLEEMVKTDEGSCMIGEVALVPQNSPISNQGILYYETLFDENASCHVALGRGYNDCIEGYETMTNDELKALGVNDSMIHVDFMVGAPDLEIIGRTVDGKDIQIFKNGNFAI